MSGFHQVRKSREAEVSNPPPQIPVPKGPDFNTPKDKAQENSVSLGF